MKHFLLFFLAVNFGIASSAQSVVNAGGSTIRTNNYIIEYSIGETVISTVSSTSSVVTQGLLQPSVKILNPDCDMINAGIVAFENPTKDRLRLVGFYDWVTGYQVFASDGRLVRSAKFYNHYIDISGLPAAGIYFVRLLPGCNGKYQVIKFMKR